MRPPTDAVVAPHGSSAAEFGHHFDYCIHLNGWGLSWTWPAHIWPHLHRPRSGAGSCCGTPSGNELDLAGIDPAFEMSLDRGLAIVGDDQRHNQAGIDDHADLMPESGEVVQVERDNGIDPMHEHGRDDVRIWDRPARAFDRVE